MANPMRKLLKISLWTLFALVLLIALLLGSLVGTESGLRLAVLKATDLDPRVSVGRIEGSLWRGFRFEDIRYDDGAGTEATIGEARFTAVWPALTARHLHVSEIALRETRIRLPGGDTEETEPTPLNLDELLPPIPLTIRVDRLFIEDFALRPAPDAEWIALRALQASASAESDQIALSDIALSLTAPIAADLRLDATLGAVHPYPLTARATGSVGLDQGRLEWSIDSSGPLERIRSLGRFDWQGLELPAAVVELDVEHGFESARIDALDMDTLDGRLSLAGTVSWVEGVIWDMTIAARELVLTPLVEQADGPLSFDLATRGTLATNGELSHESRLHGGSASFEGIAITDFMLDVAGGLDNAEIRALSLKLLDGSVAAHGQASWGEVISWQLGLDATDIDPAAVAEGATGRVSLRLDSEGQLDEDGTLSHASELANLHGDIAGIVFEEIGLKVAGDLARIRITDFAGSVLGAALSGGAELDLGEDIAWDARLSLDDADLSRLAEQVQPPIAGSIGFDLESRGTLRDGQPYLTASLSRLRGQLEGQTLAGRIDAEVAADVVKLLPADIAIGENKVMISGTVTPPFDLRYEIALPSLSALPLPEALALTGRIEGTGTVRGTLTAPEVDASLAGRGIAMDDFRLDRITVEARAQGDRLDLRAELTRLEAGGQQLDSIALTADGLLDAHRVALDARTEFGRLELGLEGGLSGETWSGRLARLDLGGTPAGDWSLQAPAAIRVTGQDFSLAQACLVERGRAGSPGRLCAAASRSGANPIDAALEAMLPLALAAEFLPPTLELPGSVSLEASARIGESIVADVLIALPDNHLVASGITEEPLHIDYRDTRVQVRLRDQQLNSELTARLPGYLDLAGGIDARLDGNQALTGTITLNMADLAWLNAVTAAVAELTGSVRAEITLGGTLVEPQPVGTIRADGLAFTVPDTGVAYRDGQFELTIDAEQQLALQGQLAGLESGTLTLAGEGSLAELPAWRLTMEVEGADLPVMRTPELVVDISPEITISANQDLANVRGRVVLPVVLATVRQLPEGSVAESPDLVIVSDEDNQGGTPAYVVRTDLEIVLGDRVRLEGMGFSTGLAGQIRLRGDETAPIAAFGEVDLRDGRYAAFGQDLRVDQGRLTFNGPLNDPGLDVRASRTVGEYQAGLEIRGTLGNPTTQVFSVPALQESDALSLLLTGRMLSSGTSGADANLLVNALAGLGVAQSDEIMRDIGQTIGFDELGLETDGGLGGTQLAIGKRLSSKLLVRYAVGVFDGVGKFITEYNINRYFDIETSSSAEAQGGDLIFRLER